MTFDRHRHMAARTFTDSAGKSWEVFEVHRTSQKVGAVSPGLENGWLAFVSGEDKRRLAPIPPEWATTTDAALEALCGSARRASPARYPAGRPLRPRLKRERQPSAAGAKPSKESSIVESTVRDFAHEARARGLPAVAAMLELKALLDREHPQPDSEARNRHSVRRWFVEAFYFDRRS